MSGAGCGINARAQVAAQQAAQQAADAAAEAAAGETERRMAAARAEADEMVGAGLCCGRTVALRCCSSTKRQWHGEVALSRCATAHPQSDSGMARSRCRFVLLLIHKATVAWRGRVVALRYRSFMPGSLAYSVPRVPKRQCDRTLQL